MTKQMVIGLGFGDEGKGLVTDWLCSKDTSQSVVRYSGGHQVGHCVRTQNKKHIFSNFGSGTMRGNPTIWNAKTIDPVGFCNEYDIIIEKMSMPLIQINPLCPVTTPYDKAFNLKREEEKQHSTMGVGFAATIAREEANYHLYFQDLFYIDLFLAKLAEIEKFYKEKGINVDYSDSLFFIKDAKRMTDLVQTNLEITDHPIYESSQGLMLDMDYGVFPYVTRSKLGTQEVEVDVNTEYYLVTRGYQTRHGNGFCSNFIYFPTGDETNVDNSNQGIFKTRVLDLDLLIYAIKIDKNIRDSKNKNLVITCLDKMSEFVLLYDGKKIKLSNEKLFIEFIINKLPKLKKVFLSHGPTSNDIKEFKFD